MRCSRTTRRVARSSTCAVACRCWSSRRRTGSTSSRGASSGSIRARAASSSCSRSSTPCARKRFEPVTTQLDGRTVTVDQAEQRSFEAALALFRNGDFRGALTAFQLFQGQYPDSPYMPSVLFWIGSSQFALKDYKGAIASHQALIAKYPDNPRAPDALLNVGYAQAESGDRRAARSTLESVIARYPQSQAAPLAKERLAKLPAR